MNNQSHNLRDSYKLYKETSENPIDIKIYLYIVNGFMKFLMKELFEYGEIKLPERLGHISIIARKVKPKIEDGFIRGLAPDWASTKKLWETDTTAKAMKKLVFFFNESTNGLRYKFFWSKNRVLVPNKTLYVFQATRGNKRQLSALIKEGKEYLIKN